jgi:hypothetical protein
LPPATADAPDGSYADENCDGIDGDVADGVFVAPSGSDSSSCGLSAVSPCQTISHGIARAALESRHHVFVQAGTYPEVAVLADGIHVWGGYDTGWQRGPHADPAHRVVISGGQDVASGESMAVRARDILQAVTLGDLVIDAPDAVGTVNRNGRSSYGVHVQNATLRLERIAILGGNGAAGSEGADGADAEVVQRQPQMNGGVGGDGREYSTVCDTTSTGGAGPRGTNTCAQSPSQRDMDAGPGGAGGQMDTDCGWCGSCGTCGNCDARSGQNGSNADFVLGSAGLRGFGSSASSSCLPATDPHGKDGAVSNGAGGLRQAGGFTANGFWYARAGLAGATGANGGGGGGGGGSAGCDDGTDAYGPGGGGGAAGGCAARAGGQGGGGGGGSFGVFVASGNVTLAACAITRGIGGNGGRGGAGGRGQDGGLGGGPGANPGAAPAGRGGNGGHGGHAGGGAGGQGGRVAGIAWLPGAMVTQDCTMSGGVPGAAGPGGLHAPAAPLRDGNDGESGLPGTLEASRVCASAGEC